MRTLHVNYVQNSCWYTFSLCIPKQSDPSLPRAVRYIVFEAYSPYLYFLHHRPWRHLLSPFQTVGYDGPQLRISFSLLSNDHDGLLSRLQMCNLIKIIFLSFGNKNLDLIAYLYMNITVQITIYHNCLLYHCLWLNCARVSYSNWFFTISGHIVHLT